MTDQVDVYVHAGVRKISNGYLVKDELDGTESFVEYDFRLKERLLKIAGAAIDRTLAMMAERDATSAGAVVETVSNVVAMPHLEDR